MKLPCFFFCLFLAGASWGLAGTYDELREAVRAAKDPGRQVEGLSARQIQVRSAWEAGKLIDQYLLERGEGAIHLIHRLASDLNDDPSRLYYALQFTRTYPDSAPALDLHWGFYQYLLSVNDPREREELAKRAFEEKWNWGTLRAEIKKAHQDNKEFVFSAVPGKTGVYRVVKAKRGPYRGSLVLDLGFANYLKPPPWAFKEYEIVEADCLSPSSCSFRPAENGEKYLFTYPADVISVLDGDTFRAMADLGFGVTTLQLFRLWGLDAPEINTHEGRQAKKALEELLLEKRVLIRALYMEKYGRYLADVWSFDGGENKPVYVNQTLIDRGLAEENKRAVR